MSFEILLGEPEILELWERLTTDPAELPKEERALLDKWLKTMELLAENPRHPGLHSHEIDDLSQKYGIRIWQSYLENRKSGARRMFWAYSPGREQITILGLERHPDTGKSKAYKRINLSGFPKQGT